MKVSKFLSGVLMVSFVCLAVAGCDALVPKKKAPVKKPVSSIAAEPTTAVATADPAVKAVEEDKDAPLAPGVLAKVGDWSISVEEFNKRLVALKKMVADFDDKDPQAKAMVLDELIRQQLMVQEARTQKIGESREIKDAVRDFENSLLAQELIVTLTKDLKATDQEAKAYYDANPDVFLKPIEKSLVEIVVPTEQEAKDILVKVLQGADFVQTAKEMSKGKSAAEGGALGFVGAEKPYAFEAQKKETDALKKGDISRVFQGPEGFYVVKVDDVRGGDKVTLEEVKADLVNGLTAQKQQQAVMERLNEVAKQVTVKVNAELIGIPANKGE